MTLSREWVEHIETCLVTRRSEFAPAVLPCPCGEKQQHTHCLGCGRMYTRGSGRDITSPELRRSLRRLARSL